MLLKMYDEKDAAFYDVYGKDNVKIKILTPTAFYPVVLKNLPEEVVEKVINRHFFNSEEFDTPYPIPSVSKKHPSFNPKESMYIMEGADLDCQQLVYAPVSDGKGISQRVKKND